MFKKLQVFTKTTNFREATKIVEVLLKEPADDEIRVRNIFVGLNATDINITAARYFTDGKIPFDIGLESLGMVDAIGSKILKFRKNQPVLVVGKADCFSEYSYVKEENLVPLPELKPEFLVCYVNGMTATIALDQAGRVKPGDKVLVTAAAGGTGQIVVQWAKHRGAYVIAMTSSEAKAEYLKKIGADFIINYRNDDLDEVLNKNFPEGIDVIWETIGGEMFVKLFNHMAIKARMVIIGSITGYKDQGFAGKPIENLQSKLLIGSKSLNGFMLTNHKEFFPEYMPQLLSRIHKGDIKALIDQGEGTKEGKFFGLDQIWRGEEYLHSGQNKGKVVVQIQNP